MSIFSFLSSLFPLDWWDWGRVSLSWVWADVGGCSLCVPLGLGIRLFLRFIGHWIGLSWISKRLRTTILFA